MASLKVGGTSMTAPESRWTEFPAPRFWIVGSLLGLGVAVAVAAISDSAGAGSVTAVTMACVAVGLSDVLWRRIPNAVVGSMFGFAVLCSIAFTDVSFYSVVGGAVVTSFTMLVLHLINPRWVGFGDVKLLFALGALLGVLWWPLGLAVLWLAAVASLLSRPFVPVAWRRSVPFGFWLAVTAVPVAIFSTKSVVS